MIGVNEQWRLVFDGWNVFLLACSLSGLGAAAGRNAPREEANGEREKDMKFNQTKGKKENEANSTNNERPFKKK